MGKYIVFSHVNANAGFPAILNHYGLEHTRSGDQIRMLCPFHEDRKPSLSITLVKTEDAQPNTFHCFGCAASGSPIDFVKLMENHDDNRAAAELVAEISNCGLAPAKGGKRGERQRAVEGPKIAGAARTGSKDSSDRSDAEKGEKAASGGAEAMSEVNPPMKWKLKTVPDHPYLSERLPADTAELFEVAYLPADSRSAMANHIVIPLHNLAGELIGYQARYPADEVPGDIEKYRLPKGFDKQHMLFNAHRVGETQDIVIVEAAFSAMRLHMLGAPVVATLGTAVSQAQVELLRSLGVRRVLLLFDGDVPGQKAIPAALDVLARAFFVTVGELPDGLDPDEVDEDELHEFAAIFEQ